MKKIIYFLVLSVFVIFIFEQSCFAMFTADDYIKSVKSSASSSNSSKKIMDKPSKMVMNKNMFEISGLVVTFVKNNIKWSLLTDDMFEKLKKMEDPLAYGINNENDYEQLKKETLKSYDERKTVELTKHEVKKTLADNGYNWIIPISSFSLYFPNTAKKTVAGVIGGSLVPLTSGFSLAVVNAYGIYLDSSFDSIELFEKKLNQGGTLQDALIEYNNSLMVNVIEKIPLETLNLIGIGYLANIL